MPGEEYDETAEGISYGPQSFDVDDRTGHLYLLDSINERVNEYDENGQYLKDFPIACGGTGDIRVSPDGKYLYVFSGRCYTIYKHKISGEFVETYPVLPNEKKMPGLGTGGLAFDENGNVMLELEIESYKKGCRFYQIGKTGEEWKENNYKGFISKDGQEYYKIKGIDWQTALVQISNKKGLLQREFQVKLPQKAYVYYKGCDKGNIYLDVAFEHGSIWDEDSYLDHFIWKYSKEGKLIAKVDRSILLRELFKDQKQIILSKSGTNGHYADYFINSRVNSEGNIYWLTTFKNEGLKIFKYSKIK